MSYLPSLADRAWFAWHCLPRDKHGKPPSLRKLEAQAKLSAATLSDTLRGIRTRHEFSTLGKIAKVLKVDQRWLEHGGVGAPVPTGPVPLRTLRHYRELPEWKDAVAQALGRDDAGAPAEAFLAGGDMIVYREAPKLTPELVTAVARYAWETSDKEEQAEYSTTSAATASRGKPIKLFRRPKAIETEPPRRSGR